MWLQNSTHVQWTQELRKELHAGSIEGSMASLFPITFWNDDKTTHIVLTLATLACPLSIVCAPVTVPVAAVWFATKRVKEGCYSGDLSPESDDCTS